MMILIGWLLIENVIGFIQHIGASKSRSPMPFGKGSKFKRKMDGTIVRREP